jgi:hypothetical protein
MVDLPNQQLEDKVWTSAMRLTGKAANAGFQSYRVRPSAVVMGA